jgi:leucyl-tRNA synthetase
VRTVQPPPDWDGGAYTGDGPAINSANDEISLDGLGVDRGQARDHRLAGREAATARRVTQYKLRDWLFSRQRYWGEPFPVVWDAARPARSRLPEDRAARRPARRSTTTRPRPTTPDDAEHRARAAAVAGARLVVAELEL